MSGLARGELRLDQEFRRRWAFDTRLQLPPTNAKLDSSYGWPNPGIFQKAPFISFAFLWVLTGLVFSSDRGDVENRDEH